MRDLVYVANDITSGKKLEENTVKYGKSLATLYGGLGFIKLTMNYYTLCELVQDSDLDECKADTRFKELAELVTDMISRLINNDNCDNLVAELEQIRNEIISKVELATKIVDHLRIYEYVLNRVEYRFDDSEFDSDYYDSRFTNDIMHYILENKDNVVINGRIAEVVGQLPMRLTRSKFLEYLNEAFSLYKGAMVGTVNDFIYNISTVAMMGDISEAHNEFGQVGEILDNLKNADYKSIEQDEYKRLSGLFTIASAKMENVADMYVILAMVVNDLYTVVLTRGAAFEDVSEIENSKKALARITEGMRTGTWFADEEMMEIFESFEGKQEKLAMSVESCDYALAYALEECEDVLERNGMLDTYHALTKVLKLQSGSNFVSLEDDSTKDAIIEDEALEKLFNDFAGNITQVFKANSQMINRAIMAGILSQLPVFFNSVDEIQGYVNVSLSQCSDIAERKACVEIMNMIIENR